MITLVCRDHITQQEDGGRAATGSSGAGYYEEISMHGIQITVKAEQCVCIRHTAITDLSPKDSNNVDKTW